jgi:hypothetical protein
MVCKFVILPTVSLKKSGVISFFPEKITLAFKYCNASVDGFYSENYTLHTNFTVFFKHTNQNFRRQDYGVRAFFKDFPVGGHFLKRDLSVR